MAKTDLKLTATDRLAKDITTTISYVNPEAGKNDILNFTQALNALTTNTYKETERIQTVNVDLETVPATPTLTASKTTYSAATDFSGTAMKDATTLSVLTYNGDGNLFISRNAYTAGFYFKTYNDAGGARVGIGYYADNPPTFPVTFTVGFTETENYKACAVEITVTA